MELTPEQIKRFVNLHKNGELNGHTEEEIQEIAEGVIQIYLTLLSVSRRIEDERSAASE